jgi:membrane-bound lytic murein transglycosylase C
MKFIKTVSSSIILSSLIATSSLAENPNDLASEFQQYEQSTKMSYKTYKETLDKEFNEYKDTLDKEYTEYKKSLSKYWNNPEIPSKTAYVEYSPDMKVKKKIDYKNNYIEINVLSKNENDAKKTLAVSLAKLVTTDTKKTYDADPVMQKVEKKLKTFKLLKTAPVKKEPLVTNMVFKKEPKIEDVKKYVYPKVKKPIVTKSKVPTLKTYTVKIKLPPRSFLVKAKGFKDDVYKNATRFKLTPELVYAIIHTESSYNPMARSHVPAFGLMQIVPKSAGADAYNMLYGKKRILSPSYLYSSSNNILIGSAYLNRLYYGYMKKIKNPISRLYCSIAAYNTGAGNVAYAFNYGRLDSKYKYNKNVASKYINTLTPEQVYARMKSKLRYDEAKHYLDRVSSRMKTYNQVLSSGKI